MYNQSLLTLPLYFRFHRFTWPYSRGPCHIDRHWKIPGL